MSNAEERLLGAALLDEKVYHEAALQYSQFADPIVQVAWKGISQCIKAEVTPDPITVSDMLGGKLSPAQLSKYTLSSGALNVQHWAGIVRNNHVKRSVQLIASSYSEWESSGLDGAAMVQKIHGQLERLESSNGILLPTLADVSDSEIERIHSSTHERVQGLPSGLGLERAVPGGISRGWVTSVSAESGNFKTTIKNNLVRGIASAGHRVLDCSFEDQDELTAARHLAGECGINYGKIASHALTGAERDRIRLTDEGRRIAENIIMGGSVLPNADEIIRTARFYKHKGGLSAVTVDYVQLLESRNGRLSPKEVLDEAMRKFQLAAKRDNLAYIILSQVKQDVNSRTDKRPQITDMLGSSAMRTASKLMIGSYKPSYYDKTPAKNSGYENLYNNHPNGHEVYENMLELHLLKNVLGRPRVIVHCVVNPGLGRIEPFDMGPWV